MPRDGAGQTCGGAWPPSGSSAGPGGCLGSRPKRFATAAEGKEAHVTKWSSPALVRPRRERKGVLGMCAWL